MKKLNEIYLKYQSPEGHGDKGTAHTYIGEYERLLEPYRNNSTVLEIGLSHGESLEMWSEYFLNSTIYGVDITDMNLRRLIELNKYNIIIDDATTENFINSLGDIMFDVIIDDGSHLLTHQISSFLLLKNKMKSNGIYIIEDVVNIDYVKNIFEKLHNNIEIVDNRHIKNRHDDVLIIYKF